jgi:hypothetical protein
MSSDAPSSILSVFARIFWMALGPLILVLLGLSMLLAANSRVGARDFVFLAVLAAMIAARWLEFRLGNPQTAMGTPATGKDLRRYAIFVAVAGMAAWGLLNLSRTSAG